MAINVRKKDSRIHIFTREYPFKDKMSELWGKYGIVDIEENLA